MEPGCGPAISIDPTDCMSKLIESLNQGVPQALTEFTALGRTLTKRAVDVRGSPYDMSSTACFALSARLMTTLSDGCRRDRMLGPTGIRCGSQARRR